MKQYYVKAMGVHEKCSIEKAWKVTGKVPIAVRRVDVNKGYIRIPTYRSRLVAKEFKTTVNPDLCTATPPS